MRVDYYNILQVSPKADEKVIHMAYRTLAQMCAADEKKLLALNNAKDVLLDAQKRKAYDAEALAKVKTIGNYKLISKIAEGGFGKTFKAEHMTLGSQVCIKHASKVSPVDEQIMLEEANAIWDLRHYGIPAIRDLFRLEDGSLALVMSYVEGPTLAQLRAKHKKIDPEHVAWIAERVLNILKYLHYNGVVHGDIKPQNIIVQGDKHQVVLVDYGLSLIRPSEKTISKGYTPYFAPPEQIKGLTLLPESDFYGLGMTLIDALGGSVDNGRQIPQSTPAGLTELIKTFTSPSILARPNWEKNDLCKTIQDVRLKDFGRKTSNMKTLNF